MFGISGFPLPDEGTHHVVSFEKATKGKYQVRAVNGSVQVTAALIPVGRIMKDATDSITAPQLPAGETQIQAYGLPYDAKVGDNLTAMVGILGEPLSNPQFVVHLEYSQIVSRQPLQFSAPVVETVHPVFARDAEGRYSATVVAQHPGILRVGVEVSGVLPNGQTFSEETVLTQVTVTPVAR
jgi:hypothetical protein